MKDWLKKEAEGQEFLAIADFIDWLVDRGYVIAKYDDEHLWTPINEEDAERLGRAYVSEASL